MKDQIATLDILAKRCRKKLYATNTPYQKQIKHTVNHYDRAKKLGEEIKKNVKSSL